MNGMELLRLAGCYDFNRRSNGLKAMTETILSVIVTAFKLFEFHDYL
ncbi:MAG: hypothetical protein QNJ46_09740 [Leptolyngbyaceae cyanobacterium MO_188.B28]|nr:hypothetical protein [Leptolyngbyaceae cyanobacterium MO_188.B28]